MVRMLLNIPHVWQDFCFKGQPGVFLTCDISQWCHCAIRMYVWCGGFYALNHLR